MKRILFALFLTLPTAAEAGVTSVQSSSAVSHMGQWTITGTSLGTPRNNGIPDIFYDARGTGLSSLGRMSSFDEVGGMSVVSTGPSTGVSYMPNAWKRDWVSCNISNDFIGKLVWDFLTAGSKFFMTYWRYISEHTTNNKYERMVGGSCDWVLVANDSQYQAYSECNESYSDRYDGSRAPTGQWFRQSTRWSRGSTFSGAETGDGTMQVIMNRRMLFNNTNVPNGAASNYASMELQQGHFDTCPSASAATYITQLVFREDWYAVLASSAGPGGTCEAITAATKFAMQIVATWNATGITGRWNLEDIDTTNGVCVTVQDDNGDRSTPMLATVGGATSLSPSLGSATQTSLTATWTNAGSSSYIGVIDDNSDFSSPISSGSVSSPQTYNSLSCGTQYYFEVKVSTEGDSAYSVNQANATTSACSGGSGTPASTISIKGNYQLQGNGRRK